MKDLDYMSITDDAIRKIKKGAFLTVKGADALNTMTIGWALIGYIWRKPVMMVAVRRTRHTFGVIETARDFTVTVPASGMEEEIAFCGTRSGRDVDKFKTCGLETAPGQKVVSPIIKTLGYHYECRIVYKTAMDPAFLDKDYDADVYPLKDYHSLYFGEIMACYGTD